MYAYQLIRRLILLTDFKCCYLIVDISRMLLKLPIGFFDSKNLGDIIQRIDDHRRVQQFLSNSTLDVLFSAVNIIIFIIFGAALLHYSLQLFLVFLIGSSIYLTWVLMFMRKRAELEYKRFDEATRALDANNERKIMENMEVLLRGRHRCGGDPSSGHRQECRSDRRARGGPAHRKRDPLGRY
jgi:ABC-type bacteriocin/lantibiotic exporter with double-glycine peptidase domain